MTQTGTPTQTQADGFPLFPIPPDLSTHVAQLPLREWKLDHCPAIPYWADTDGDPDLHHILTTIMALAGRAEQGMAAYCGLSIDFTIDNQSHPAYTFLYGTPLPPPCGAGAGNPPAPGATPPNELALDHARDFTLPWTKYGDVYDDSQDLVRPFAETLTDAKKATDAFWPTIASFGLPYNLLVLTKVDAKLATELRKEFGDDWAAAALDDVQAADLLYAIDTRILASLEPFEAPDGSVRFTPGTVTLLTQDSTTKALTPVIIKVWTANGATTQTYNASDNAWLYALQAAKTSITVWGIWLGHVYHWHIVTAAMQMTMYNHLPADNRLWPLLRPQSKSLIDFDYVLLSFLWGKISPPTPVDGFMSFLKLINQFAVKRKYFEDDPLAELKKRRLDVKDFTVKKDWDAYPVVGYLLEIWGATEEFVKAVVDDLYKHNDEVVNDNGLQAWLAASGDPLQGNIRGLGTVDTRDKLTAVLTSLLYRVNVHGAGSLTPSVNPALSFISNFPPCLQSADLPQPGDVLTKKELLERMPHTGTMGGMTTFYFTFVYSPPYEPLIPADGVDHDQYFPSSETACNAALVAFRKRIHAFVDVYVEEWNEALAWFRGAPGSVPSYADDQYEQWPLSIEI